MGWKRLYIILGSLIIISGVLLAEVLPAVAATPNWEDVGNQLMCQCGCNAVLPNCAHQECSVRDSMTTTIKQKLDQGQSEKAILQYFVGQYGEQVLSSPPKKGFNLVAWILPFAAIIAAGLAIYLAIKVWVKRGSSLQPNQPVQSDEEDEKYLKRIDKELKDYSERGFR